MVHLPREQNINIIKEIYPALQIMSDLYAQMTYQKIYEQYQVIKEYIKSVDHNKVAKELSRIFPGKFRIVSNITQIVITYNTIETELLDLVHKQMDAFGWYPNHVGNLMTGSGVYDSNIKNFVGRRNIPISYKRKTGITVKPKNNFLYHLIPDMAYQKVKSFGLITKTQSKLSNHPDRIYLFDGIPDNIQELSDYLVSHHKYKNKINKMYLLEIPTNKLKTWEFFEDDEFLLASAIWTYQMIPPGYIKVISEFPNTQKDPEHIIKLDEIREVIQQEIKEINFDYILNNFSDLKKNHGSIYQKIHNKLLIEYRIELNDNYQSIQFNKPDVFGYYFYDVNNSKHLTILKNNSKIIFGRTITNDVNEIRLDNRTPKFSKYLLGKHINNIIDIVNVKKPKSIILESFIINKNTEIKYVVITLINELYDMIDNITYDICHGVVITFKY